MVGWITQAMDMNLSKLREIAEVSKSYSMTIIVAIQFLNLEKIFSLVHKNTIFVIVLILSFCITRTDTYIN